MAITRLLSLGVFVGAVLATANGSAAQELRGRITGIVTDNSGAVLPGVTV